MSDAYQDYCNANYGPEDIPAPEILVDCEACDGRGYVPRTIHVYEAGCGFSHPDVEEIPCAACGGNGWFLCEAT